MTEDPNDAILREVRAGGSVTTNQIARRLKRKHETIARVLHALEIEGKVYAQKSGKRTYYTIVPNSISERVRPDSGNFPPKMEIKTEGYGRGSVNVSPQWPHRRASTPQERIPEKGSVLWPSVKGCDVGREWNRAHHSGQYHVMIVTVGSKVPFNPETNDTFQWSTSLLTTQKVLNCNVNPHKNGEQKPYKVKTVSKKNGQFSKLDIYVHSRYVYYIGHEETASMEFLAQVDDVLTALEGIGWAFDRDTITFTGRHHIAINDPTLGGLVGHYNEKDTDLLHYDRSPGYPEVEIYGQDPETVEMMVRLPEIIKAFGLSIHRLNVSLGEVVDMQSKIVQLVTPQAQQTQKQTQDNGIMFR